MPSRILPGSETRSDASLLAAARDDPDAFGELYDRYAQAVRDYFARRTGDRSAALELTAETFAQAWLVRTRFRDEAAGSAAPWIYGIARNVLLMSIRRRALERRAAERLGVLELLSGAEWEPFSTPEDAWADGADELLDSLPADQREAVRLRVVEDLGYAEVAAVLGTTSGAARVRVHRGLMTLRKHLTQPGGNHS